MTVLAGICYGWAAIGIGSRIAMALMGSRWDEWETEHAYAERRPAWVVWVALVGIVLIATTWYVALTGEARLGWIVAVLLSLSGVKIGAFLFQYERFRDFVKRALADRQKMMALNGSVIAFSLGLVALGYFLYS